MIWDQLTVSHDFAEASISAFSVYIPLYLGTNPISGNSVAGAIYEPPPHFQPARCIDGHETPVQRANLTAKRAGPITGQNRAIALDPVHGKMYWTITGRHH
jgi:hypothetical protein